LWSRYAARRALAPSPEAGDGGFAAEIGRQAVEHGPLVVYPGSESAIEALVTAAPSLPAEAVLPYARLDALRIIRDKHLLPGLGADVGLRAPRTLAHATAAELAHSRLPEELVVKSPLPGGAVEVTQVFGSRRELVALLGGLPADEPVLVQEQIAGPVISLELVIGPDGTVLGRFQQLFLRTWPPAAGGCALSMSVPVDPRLLERVKALLEDVGYTGLIQIQVIDTGTEMVLIDMNPRFYGPLPLSQACGLNLPAIWHASVVSHPDPSAEAYRLGVSYRRLEADVAAARSGQPGRLLYVAPRPCASGMWASDDPLPGAMLGAEVLTDNLPLGRTLLSMVRMVLGRLLRRLAPDDGAARRPRS
jgi:predicted ATP-grasp superfamily ATP-dependent carboligase